MMPMDLFWWWIKAFVFVLIVVLIALVAVWNKM